MVILFVLAALLAFLAVEELSRRFPVFTVLFYIALPAVLTPLLWLGNGIDEWFRWAKVYSVILAVIVVTLLRYTRLRDNPVLKWAIALILVGNILEAVVQDITGMGTFHYLNAAAGLLLLPSCFKIADMAVAAPKADLSWDSTNLFWIIGYTIWNWTFVTLNFPEHSAHHMAVLGAALVIGLINPRVWLQARAYTLAAYMIVYFSFPAWVDSLQFFDFNQAIIQDTAAVTSLAVMAAYNLWFFGKKLRRAKA